MSTGEARRTRWLHGEGKRGSGGEESTEQSSPVSLAGTPASDSRGEEAYHGKLRQARATREGGGARSKTERLTVSRGGRNGQLRRGAARAVAEESRSACAAAAVERREGIGSEQRRQPRCGGSRRARGARGPPDGQVLPSPTHAVHAAASAYRSRALARGSGRVRGPGPAKRCWARREGRGHGREAELSGPSGFGQWAEWEARAQQGKSQLFLFIFQIQN
jgi:hypothetical protein